MNKKLSKGMFITITVMNVTNVVLAVINFNIPAALGWTMATIYLSVLHIITHRRG